MTGPLSYNKLCELEDFRDAGLRTLIRDVFSFEIESRGPDFPTGFEYRKYWEVAMAVRTLKDFGALHERAEILGVGAGTEMTIFWLTNRVRRVFATDLYLEPGATWERTATSAMLAEPERFAPPIWNPRRLVVQHMDALELRYEDESFDGVFSSSSIEHFGTEADVRRAIGEIFRVLRPGGAATLSTEFRLEGPPLGLEGTLMFDRDELLAAIGGLDWSLVSPFETELSPATAACEVSFSEAAEDVIQERGSWRSYPHIVLRHGELLWTSVHLGLRKHGQPAQEHSVGLSSRVSGTD
jgi:SAM-dependent methyltransferase